MTDVGPPTPVYIAITGPGERETRLRLGMGALTLPLDRRDCSFCPQPSLTLVQIL